MKEQRKKTITKLVFFITPFIIVGILIRSPKLIDKTFKEAQLRIFYSKIIELDKEKDYYSLYDYELPTFKNYISRERYVEIKSRGIPSREVVSDNVEVKSYSVEGNIGIVRRIRTICYTRECKGADRVSIMNDTVYIFSDGRWYLGTLLSGAEEFALPSRYLQLCDRRQPYPIPSEFKRIISLIQQRMSGTNYTSVADYTEAQRISKDIDRIYNCLEIKYASTNEELEGAEGVFKFQRGGSTDRLQIRVSPDYAINDDLLTALLLAHELSHAFNYAYDETKASIGDPDYTQCYEDEALAFTQQITLFRTLNKSEQESLISRYVTSPDAFLILKQMGEILGYPGNSIFDKSLNYVKASSFYKKQCSKNQ